MQRPKFSDLTPEEKESFSNGLGPWWFPDWLRSFITKWASWFFEDASWRHHDFGYFIGCDEFDRLRCDRKFKDAMLRDAWSQPKYRIIRIPLALFLAWAFYFAVRTFGRRSFQYRDRYATLEEIRNIQAI